jgi:glycosyltransferase involved in cell wall biosynthesis
MRVLMLTSDYLDSGFGGVEWHIYNLASALRRQDVDVEVVRTSRRLARFSPPTDVSFHVVGPAGLGLRNFMPKVRRPASFELGLQFTRRVAVGVRSYLKEPQLEDLLASADVVHQHDFLEGWGRSRRAASQVPVVWTNHLGEFLKLRALPRSAVVLNRLTEHYSWAIGPSRELADERYISAPVSYIPNGVDIQRYVPVDAAKRSALRRELGWGNEPVVIVPRRWAPTKGVLFAAAAVTSSVWPVEARLVFAGAGISEYPGYVNRVMTQLRRARGIVEVHDRLPIAKMTAALAAADACMIPSLEEATSLAALEAMASGIPIIATNVGGLTEIITEGENGFLVPPGNSEALAFAVNRILNMRPEERLKMSSCANLRAQEFSWDEVARKTLSIYQRVKK